MKKQGMLATWTITVVFLIVTGWYAAAILWGTGSDKEIPGIVRWGLLGLVFFILLPIMVMMVITAVKRKREIEKGEDDDLGKY